MPAFLDDPEEHNPQRPKIGKIHIYYILFSASCGLQYGRTFYKVWWMTCALTLPCLLSGCIPEDVLHTLTGAMSLLRRCRVNAALTIQLFSQLFHFINMWLFNKLVTDKESGLCCHYWGAILRQQLSHIEAWAEKQGLELAADCHLSRIVQVSLLLVKYQSNMLCGDSFTQEPDWFECWSVALRNRMWWRKIYKLFLCPPGYNAAHHGQVLHARCAEHPQHLF